MKNVSKIIGVACAIALLLAGQVRAASPVLQNFINGQYLQLVSSNALATQIVNYNQTNAAASYVNTAGTLINSGTNALGTVVGAWEADAQGYSDANGVPAAQSLVLSITAGPLAAGNTNGFTFNFARSGDGTYYDTNTAAGVAGGVTVFSVVMTNVSAATTNGNSVLITNFPSWFLAGAQKIRLHSIIASTNATTSTNIIRVWASGWVP